MRIEEVGIKRMSAEDQRAQPKAGSRASCCEKSSSKYLNVSEWELYQAVAKRLSSGATRRSSKLPRAEFGLGAGHAASRIPSRRMCCCAATRTCRATWSSRTFPRCSASRAGDSAGRAEGRVRPAGAACWPTGSLRRENMLDSAGDRQSRLAAPFWPRDRPFGEQFWRAGHAADASGAARLAGAVADRPRLAAQAAAPADHDLERLSDVVGRQRAGAGRRSGERSVLAVRHAAAECRGGPRLDAGRVTGS